MSAIRTRDTLLPDGLRLPRRTGNVPGEQSHDAVESLNLRQTCFEAFETHLERLLEGGVLREEPRDCGV